MSFSSSNYLRSTSSTFQPTGPSLGSTIYRQTSIKKYRAPSVHGGAGGYGTRISTGVNYGSGSWGSLGSGFQPSTFTNDLLLAGNEKVTMQNLNDRLALYLEKVRSLETANSHLEKQIREWFENSSPTARQDYTAFYKTIEDLQNQIITARLENTQLILQIDNTKLAADDFRVKFETELGLRQNVENDMAGLLRLIDDLTLIKADLEHQVEGLKEELAYLKKNHEEETERFRRQLSGTVTVEVDAAPSIDLGQIMANMRQQYEAMAEKHRQEAKQRFEKQIEEWNVEITTNTQQVESNRNEITDRRRILQGLEIEFQSELSLKTNTETAVAEVEARYGVILAQIQASIANVEAQLLQLREDMERQSSEYNSLLDVKVQLEAEIATYRRLLEGEDSRAILELEIAKREEAEREKNKVRKIKTVVEEMVDGKVVSSQIREREEKM
ncbi:keratin, type I cytoskeletal 19-like [Eublepharis macularius]|uniref:Keratin, type I cytoskeletal 20 n=1 Tax=Eublepharis macularius TaxID=481883 RepID=A0AA97K519_EUBMA|nr:keratin, type I cytoskeletal 19-like [Eublepharis macularius]